MNVVKLFGAISFFSWIVDIKLSLKPERDYPAFFINLNFRVMNLKRFCLILNPINLWL